MGHKRLTEKLHPRKCFLIRLRNVLPQAAITLRGFTVVRNGFDGPAPLQECFNDRATGAIRIFTAFHSRSEPNRQETRPSWGTQFKKCVGNRHIVNFGKCRQSIYCITQGAA